MCYLQKLTAKIVNNKSIVREHFILLALNKIPYKLITYVEHLLKTPIRPIAKCLQMYY